MTFKSFHDDFRYGPDDETHVSAISVGIQQAGAFVGCFAIWPINNRYGRRPAIVVCSIIFCAGVILEILNLHFLPLFYLGRIICGLGVGGSSSVIPVYLSEMSPKEIRGRLGSCYQLMFTVGILISYWVDYAVKFLPSGPWQWQIPIALQLVPGGAMGLGVLTLEESVRWLVSQGEEERAQQSLAWVRASAHPEDIEDELIEIQRGIEQEKQARSGFSPMELLEWPYLHRILLAIGMFCAQQATGATAMAYFGPQFFALLVGPGDKNLLLTGIFGLIKVASCATFIIFISDRFGRRTLLLSGAIFMSICMIITSAIVKIYVPTVSSPSPPTILDVQNSSTSTVAADITADTATVTIPGILTVALIYLTIIAFNLSWGPLPWPYVSEIFPTRIREPGVAFGVGSQWAFNFIWSSATPYLLVKLGGWPTFLLFGCLDIAIVFFVLGCVRETARKSLEEIAKLFDEDHHNRHHHNRYRFVEPRHSTTNRGITLDSRPNNPTGQRSGDDDTTKSPLLRRRTSLSGASNGADEEELFVV